MQLDRGQATLTAARRSQRRIQSAAVAGAVVVVFLLVGVSLLFTRSVSRPLERVVRQAHPLAGGDFDRPALPIPESAELREVALGFNRMTDSIRGLLQDLRDKHALERRLDRQELQTAHMERLVGEAQLVALQSQVNPHFLFKLRLQIRQRSDATRDDLVVHRTNTGSPSVRKHLATLWVLYR